MRKFATVEMKYAKSDFDRQQYAVSSLMCIYGIELLEDNIAECKENLLEIFSDYLNLNKDDALYACGDYVLTQNIVHGDALTMKDTKNNPIVFAEWGYLGKGKFQRRDFRFDVLTSSSAFSAEDSLFANLGMHEIFQPIKTYKPMRVAEIASQVSMD